jgi:hypothetical protein
MNMIKGFGRFWYDFLIGDDWKIAAAVVTVLVVGALMLGIGALSGGLFAVLVGASVMGGFVIALVVDVRA